GNASPERGRSHRKHADKHLAPPGRAGEEMIRCTVVWVSAADNELALLWTQAQDRNAVSQAANRIERALAVDPNQKGHQLDNYRVYVAAPLAVVYEVSEDDRLVRILRVRSR